HRYILLNKPRGYVTTRSDPERRKTVIDLLRGVKEYVYPVGRLDYESEGLLLLMNDGDLAARLTHPSHGIARVYEATVLGIPDAHDLERLQRGMVIDGRRMRASEVALLPLKRDATGATRGARPVIGGTWTMTRSSGSRRRPRARRTPRKTKGTKRRRRAGNLSAR